MTKAKTVVVTFQQFARGIGASDRITLEASLAWHKEYVGLSAEKQSEWRHDWVLNYVIGKLDCTPKQAEDICAKTRVQRTANQEKAVNCGSKRFAEHISRTMSRSGRKVAVKFTREQVQACDNALASFKADKLSAQIKMLRAYLASLEAK